MALQLPANGPEPGGPARTADVRPLGHRIRVPKTAELVAADLRRKIVRGELAEGDALPSEAALMAELAVSRPTLREAFRWAANGALVVDESISTTSSRSRYSLAPGFAALLDPALNGAALDAAIDRWQRAHLSPTARLRAQRLREQERRRSAVVVRLPDGGTRELLVGQSSDILKGVIEEFTRYLSQPTVLFVSQPGEKANVVDSELLRTLRLSVDQQRLLPDALIVDLDAQRDEFWFVEVVATDGPVDEDRKARLLGWAMANGLDTGKCRFLTAFPSRTSAQAKKALPVLARGTFAWFLDEPDALLSW